MLKTNSTFDTYNALSQKKPVFIWKIYDSTDAAFLTTKFCTGTFADIDANYKKVITTVQIKSMPWEPLEKNHQYGTCQIDLLDSSGAFLAMGYSDVLHNRRCLLYYGFQEMNVADFILFHEYYINEIKYGSNKKVAVSMVNIISRLDFPALDAYGSSVTTSDIADADEHIDVTSNSTFTHPDLATGAWAPWSEPSTDAMSIVCAIVHDEVYVRITDLTGADIINIEDFDSLGNLTYTTGKIVVEFFHSFSYLYGRLILQILTTTTAGTNGDYDLGLANWGLGISISKIDIIQILNECVGKYNKWALTSASASQWAYIIFRTLNVFGNKQDKFTRPDANKGLDILEELLLKIPAKFIITENNKLGIKILDVYAKGEGLVTITEDDLLSDFEVELDRTEVITDIKVTYPGYSLHKNMIKDETLISNWPNSTVKSVYLNHNNTYETELRQPKLPEYTYIFQRIFGVYGDIQPKIRVPIKMKYITLQPCDLINMTLPTFVNFYTGTIGITNECFKIISNDIIFDEGTVSCDLYASNIQLNNKSEQQTLKTFMESDIDVLIADSHGRKILLEDATGNATLEAEDAYIDNETPCLGTEICVGFQLTLPADAGGIDDAYITVQIHLQYPNDTDLYTVEKRIYYDETASGTQYTELYALQNTFDNFTRIKMDWTAHSGDHPPSAVKITKVRFWNFKPTITERVIQ